MIIIEINGVEYQVNIAPSLNLSVANTKYPRVIRGDFFVNGRVLDQDGNLLYNMTSGRTVEVNTGQTLTELWNASTTEEKIVLYLALTDLERADLQEALPDLDLFDLYEALTDERRLYLFQQLTDANRLYLYAGIDDDERLYLFVNLPTQDQYDLYNSLEDAKRLALFNQLPAQDQIDLYNGLTNDLRDSLFEQLTDAQKDYILPLEYNYPVPTGQVTSYASFDDADLESGANQIWPALRAAQAKWARRPRLGADFYTLLDNNIHGNTRRFTLANGNEPALNTAGQYIQDHFTGLAFITGASASHAFATVFAYAEGLSFAGFSDYHVANENIALSWSPKNMINKYDSRTINQTSTTAFVTTTSVIRLILATDAQVTALAKTTANTNWLLYRIF